MSVAGDILATWRHPGRVVRRRMGDTPREDRALAVLMLACALVFVAQWPRLARLSFETGQELNPLLGGALFAWLFIMPLVLYALGTLSHWLARLAGGRGSAYGARFALFWALLAASPLWLLWGLVAGFIGPGPALNAVGVVALGAFVIFWAVGLVAAESGAGPDAGRGQGAGPAGQERARETQ